MTAKQPAAIIEGTMASPSSPSVKFTEFEAPTMTKTPNGTKNQPSSSSTFLKNGRARAVPNPGGEMYATAMQATAPSAASRASLARPESPWCEFLVSFR